MDDSDVDLRVALERYCREDLDTFGCAFVMLARRPGAAANMMRLPPMSVVIDHGPAKLKCFGCGAVDGALRAGRVIEVKGRFCGLCRREGKR